MAGGEHHARSLQEAGTQHRASTGVYGKLHHKVAGSGPFLGVTTQMTLFSCTSGHSQDLTSPFPSSVFPFSMAMSCSSSICISAPIKGSRITAFLIHVYALSHTIPTPSYSLPQAPWALWNDPANVLVPICLALWGEPPHNGQKRFHQMTVLSSQTSWYLTRARQSVQSTSEEKSLRIKTEPQWPPASSTTWPKSGVWHAANYSLASLAAGQTVWGSPRQGKCCCLCQSLLRKSAHYEHAPNSLPPPSVKLHYGVGGRSVADQG